jgi:hypothetical protein
MSDNLRPLIWMILLSVVSSGAVLALVRPNAGGALVFGMIGPLAAASASWVSIQRTFRRSPERLTSVMTAAFAIKLVFFGLYVAIALRVLMLGPVPFVASFTSYFVGLYIVEAVFLYRLFGSGADARAH